VSGESGDFRRWRQAVRRQVRLFVTEERDAPPMVVWTSRNVRKPGEAVRVGAGENAGDVAANVRAAVVDGDGAFAAFGRRLHEGGEDGTRLSGAFGLVVAGEHRFETWEVTIRAGELLAWAPGSFDGAQVGGILLAALRAVQKEREEMAERARAVVARELATLPGAMRRVRR
jgi:hypothetical protein